MKNHRKTRFFGFSRMRLPCPRAAQEELRDATCRVWARCMIKNKTCKISEFFHFFRWKLYFRKNWKTENFENLFFIEKFQEKNSDRKMWLFSIFVFFRFFNFPKIKFSSKKWKISGIFQFLFLLSYLVPKPCKWRRATPPVPPVGAANASPKIRKIMFFDDFRWFFDDFSSKSGADDLLSGLIWLWDPVLRRDQLQTDLARSSSGVMRTSAAR